MYDWLDAALRDSSHVLTASSRLARVLKAEFSEQKLAAGALAWRSPSIQSWQDWLTTLLKSAKDQELLPTSINSYQSRCLWERCLRREVSDPLMNIAMLARQSRDSWMQLQKWRVPLRECRQRARNRDQQLFADVASSYQSILDREGWVDEAGLANLATELICQGQVTVPARLTIAGFDRLTPQLEILLGALRDAACVVEQVATRDQAEQVALRTAETSDTELRSAGAWAKRELSHDPRLRLAIVVTHLEQDAQRNLRLIKEGLIPGWQNAGQKNNAVVDISYGRKLTNYPAISTALLALRWLHGDLSTRDVSLLLRSTLLAPRSDDERIRLEMRLRKLPDRSWSPTLLLAETSAWRQTDDGHDALSHVVTIARRRAELPTRQSPEDWVSTFHEVLQELDWPGHDTLNSAEFQLINRWRELLNDVARLSLVSSSITASEALGHVASIAAEVVYQPEANGALLQVIGPLEAAGMEFDKLWVTGLSGNNWPPPGRPLSLVSRELQRDYGMPDADPSDTLQYSERVIGRLASSGTQVIFSYPQTEKDVQLSASGLLAGLALTEVKTVADPGWNARALQATASTSLVGTDPVPGVGVNESIAGGAATIQRQTQEPFAAFVYGRLGVQALSPIASGLTASLRGSLIHSALHHLYTDCPSRDDIQGWSANEIGERTLNAVHAAFRPQERHADPVLKILLSLEMERVQHLLKGVIALEAEREQFQIKSVEEKVDASIGGIEFRLRVDRVDQDTDGEILILDYKTGAPKRLLDRSGEPKELQLVVYTFALAGPVSGIGLLNVDTRSIAMDGAGRKLSPKLNWDDALARWKEKVTVAANAIAAGDVRINTLQNTQAARPLSILSRYQELLRDR
jgi:probable DNA repair protein